MEALAAMLFASCLSSSDLSALDSARHAFVMETYGGLPVTVAIESFDSISSKEFMISPMEKQKHRQYPSSSLSSVQAVDGGCIGGVSSHCRHSCFRSRS